MRNVDQLTTVIELKMLLLVVVIVVLWQLEANIVHVLYCHLQIQN